MLQKRPPNQYTTNGWKRMMQEIKAAWQSFTDTDGEEFNIKEVLTYILIIGIIQLVLYLLFGPGWARHFVVYEA